MNYYSIHQPDQVLIISGKKTALAAAKRRLRNKSFPSLGEALKDLKNNQQTKGVTAFIRNSVL